MKAEVKDLSAVKKSLTVEADADAVERETEQVVRRWAGQVRIPGFRPGKAPFDIVRKRFAREIEEDVRERLVARLFREAATENGLKPLGDPVLDELQHEDGAPFRFKTTFDVLPEFTVKGYRGIEVREPSTAVDEPEVEQTLESLRQSRARFVTEEGRTSQLGDVLVADVEEEPEGLEIRKRERVLVEVGMAEQPAAFNDAILGAAAGARLSFAVNYSHDHPAARLAGKSVRYKIDVHEVKRKELPMLDDEFAKDLGEFADLAALRARVRADLEARRRTESSRAVRQSILDKVLLENPVPLPDILVEEELHAQLEDVARSMILHGVDPRSEQIDWKALRDRQEDQARKTVHARLVLDSVAELESLSVSNEEVNDRLRAEAERLGESLDAVRSRLQKGGGLEALRAQLVREKSLDFLTSVGHIQHAE